MDYKGAAIADIINPSNFIVLNNGAHTYVSDSTGLTSAPDITLAHIDIARDMVWDKIFETLDSDHYILKKGYRPDKITHNSANKLFN